MEFLLTIAQAWAIKIKKASFVYVLLHITLNTAEKKKKNWTLSKSKFHLKNDLDQIFFLCKHKARFPDFNK